MAKKRHTVEPIIDKLREGEVLLGQGVTVAQACKKVEVTQRTCYRWRPDYGGMRTDQGKRLKELDKAILKEAASGWLRPQP